jgi:sarcosine oxidase
MIHDYDAIVVGLGVGGASLTYALARRGLRTLGLEARAPDHTYGSSHGDSRITRTAVGEGLAYVPLAERSEAVWADLEARGHALRHPTGVLYLVGPGAGATMHGTPDFLTTTRAAGDAAGVTTQALDAEALRTRFPLFAVAPGTQALFEPGAGVLRPEACVTALLAEARAAGATLRHEEPMRTLSADGARAIVDTSAGRYRAPKIYLCLGAWAPAFAGGRFARDLRVLRQVLYWFAADPAWAAAPAYIWFHGPSPEDSFYGFPSLDGRTVKVATEQYTTTGDPDHIDRNVSAAEAATLHAAHIAGRLTGVSDRLAQARVCLYTHNANPAHPGRFLVAPHPDVAAATIVSACSGHGFKHALGLAEALAGQLTGEAPFCDLSVFA